MTFFSHPKMEKSTTSPSSSADQGPDPGSRTQGPGPGTRAGIQGSSRGPLVNWHLEWFPLLPAHQGGAPLGSPPLTFNPHTEHAQSSLLRHNWPAGDEADDRALQRFTGALILIPAAQ